LRTIAGRLRTPTLSNTLDRWFCTVQVEMCSVAAIRSVEAPLATSAAISRSLGVSP
jgi:hypothetical protein